MNSTDTQEVAELKEDLQDALKKIEHLEQELVEAYENGPPKHVQEQQKPSIDEIERVKAELAIAKSSESAIRFNLENNEKRFQREIEKNKNDFIRALSLLRSIVENEKDITSFLRSGPWMMSRNWIRKAFDTNVLGFMNTALKGKKS